MLAKDESLQQHLINNITPLAITNADEVVAAEILRLSQGNSKHK